MRFSGIRKLVGVAAALALTATIGCDKAKDALKDALGADQLTQEEVDAMLVEAGWDAEKNPQLANFTIHGGIRLTDNFKGDLSDDVSIPVPFDMPEQGAATAENQRSIALLRKESFTVGDTDYVRFRIITVGKYDAEAKELSISGKEMNQYLDESQVVSVANANQAGDYLLVEGKGDKGLAYLQGTVNVKPYGKDATAAADAVVFTSSSPFVTKTGSTGKYFLAMLDGSKGDVVAYMRSWDTAFKGTPNSTSVPIPYAGALDKYKEAFDSKVDSAGSAAGSEKADDLFNQANTKISDYLGLWTLVEANLTFTQPVQEEPTPVSEAPADVQPEPPQPPTEPEPVPATDPLADEEPAAVRVPIGDEDAPQSDLGCAGFDDEFNGIDMVRNGANFDDYAGTKGWRAMGDAHYAYDYAEAIFGAPESELYLDEVPGYCVVTTGNAYAKALDDEAYTPGPDGAGQVSELWQKVAIPSTAKSMQLRVAFFSQEFPEFVGTQYNDSFFVKFDESLDFIVSGNLNDLAGDGASDCGKAEKVPGGCGDWKHVPSSDAMDGELFGISYSSEAPAQGSKYGCMAKGNDANGKCYHGMIEPRMVCHDLTADEAGKTLTLRINVSDAGDKFFDSALAVDSIVFTNKACNEPEGRMTDEPDSRASMVE
jgi:hypothetical protein